jgi:hypothetical protein
MTRRNTMVEYGDNIFGIVGEAMREIRKAGHPDQAKRLAKEVQDCKSYDEANDLVEEFLVAYT